MFCHTPAVYVLGCLLQVLPRIPLVHGAVIPQSEDITATSSTVGINRVKCNDLLGWVEEGIVRSDCAAAIGEFFSTSVRPRGNQEYEFLIPEVHQVSGLPSVVPPIKFYHGGYPAFSLGFGLPHSIHISRHVQLYCCNDEYIQYRAAARWTATAVPTERYSHLCRCFQHGCRLVFAMCAGKAQSASRLVCYR